MMSAKKKSANTSSAKQRRRRTLTFVRMCRYGINNFSRNVWLTVAATAVMSITLLIIFVTLVARVVLLDTVTDISSKVDMSIYLKSDVSEENAQKLQEEIAELSNTKEVKYISPDEARDDQAKQSKQDEQTLKAIKEASNMMPGTLRVYLHDINDTTQLDEYVNNSELFEENRDQSREPSFQGERRTAINRIGEWVRLAEIGGGAATLVFLVISSLVVFNTIRMAIFNRKDEIQMMKLIGADRSFIRGPFLVEAIMYGFIAAVVATGAGYGLMVFARQPLSSYGLPLDSTLDMLVSNVGIVIVFMVLAGAIIGSVSSYVATIKYLKV